MMEHITTSELLIAALKNGNKEVFKTILEKYYDIVVERALRRTFDMEAAKALASDTFVTLWQDREKLTTCPIYLYLLFLVDTIYYRQKAS